MSEILPAGRTNIAVTNRVEETTQLKIWGAALNSLPMAGRATLAAVISSGAQNAPSKVAAIISLLLALFSCTCLTSCLIYALTGTGITPLRIYGDLVLLRIQ